MTELKPGETIDPVCPVCGLVREAMTHATHPNFIESDIIIMVCHKCARRHQVAQPMEFLFVEENPIRNSWRFGP